MVGTALSLAAAVALAFASGQDAPSGGEAGCVEVRGVSGHTVIDDRHLILHGAADRHYLLTTRTRCSGMRAGAGLAFSFGEEARLCPPLSEHLTPDDGWRCAIEEVIEVESEAAARALVLRRAEGE